GLLALPPCLLLQHHPTAASGVAGSSSAACSAACCWPSGARSRSRCAPPASGRRPAASWPCSPPRSTRSWPPWPRASCRGPAGGPGCPPAEAVDCAGKIDALLARVHPEAGPEFRQLLHLFENALFGLTVHGSPTPFSRLAPEAQDARLDAWRSSRLALLRSGF